MESTIDIVHAAQWGALRAWADTLTPEQRQLPSSLPGWTVDDLLSHLARSVDAIGSLRPVRDDPVTTTNNTDNTDDADRDTALPDPNRPAGGRQTSDDVTGTSPVTPMSIGEYLSGFAGRAETIAEQTRKAAAGSAADRGGELDAAYNQARRTLTALGSGDPVVQAPGGRIRLSDFLATRLIELVVHARDLHRSVPDAAPPPILDTAVDLVESTLRQALRDKAGVVGDDTDLARLPGLQFIDVASGREPAPERLGSVVRAQLPLF